MKKISIDQLKQLISLAGRCECLLADKKIAYMSLVEKETNIDCDVAEFILESIIMEIANSINIVKNFEVVATPNDFDTYWSRDNE